MNSCLTSVTLPNSWILTGWEASTLKSDMLPCLFIQQLQLIKHQSGSIQVFQVLGLPHFCPVEHVHYVIQTPIINTAVLVLASYFHLARHHFIYDLHLERMTVFTKLSTDYFQIKDKMSLKVTFGILSHPKSKCSSIARLIFRSSLQNILDCKNWILTLAIFIVLIKTQQLHIEIDLILLHFNQSHLRSCQCIRQPQSSCNC